MAENEKITAVYEYIGKEFDPCSISDSYDAGREAQAFEIQSGNSRHKFFVACNFLKKNSARAIPDILRTFLLAEHIRECSFPITVTLTGLTD